MAQSSRPPATEAGESTQMSVIETRRPPGADAVSVEIGRATSSSL